jgi:drug/metabolite transporter (DMT)-like permease
VDGWAWGGLLFSGGLAVGLMFVLWNQAVRRVGSSNTAVYYYLVPVVALVAGVVLIGEPITVLQIVGGGLIIGGLALVRRSG